MKNLLLLLALLPGMAAALPIVSFDQVGAQSGTASYDGVGGPFSGRDIDFDTISGVDTPLNNGAVLECRDCILTFDTGANITEAPTYTWGGGGSLSITGDAYDGVTLIASGILASGSFLGGGTGAAGTVSTSIIGDSGLFTGVGLDAKHPDLVDFFGLPEDFVFVQSVLSLGGCVLAGNGGFDCDVSNADFDNASLIPAPGVVGLMGVGLLALGVARRRS